MNQKLSPKVAAVVVLIVIGVVALSWARFSSVSQGDPRAAANGIPQEAQAEFQKRLGTKSLTSGGGTAPGTAAPGGAH